MIVDDKEKLARQLDMNPGNKTSSLETVGRLDIDGNMAKGAKAREDFNPGPIDGVDLSDLPPLPDDLPPLPDAGAAAPVGQDQAAKPEPTPDRAEQLPPPPGRTRGRAEARRGGEEGVSPRGCRWVTEPEKTK